MRRRLGEVTLLVVAMLLGLPAWGQQLQVRGHQPAGDPPISETSKKIVSRLRGLIIEFQALGITHENAAAVGAASRLSSDFLRLDSAGRIQIYVSVADTADTSDQTLGVLRGHGLMVEIINRDFGIVQGWIPVLNLDALAAEPVVVKIRPPSYGTPRTGPINSQGDAIHRCDQVRALGITGAGVKVGVVSNGVDGLAAAQASGELPFVQVLAGGTGDEGTAMLEIVHDCAPGAALAFSEGFSTSLAFIASVGALRDAGARIIVDDVGFFAEPYFQDGMVALNDRAVGNSVLRVSAAGNSRGSHYAAVFNPGIFDAQIPGTRHNFGGGDTLMRFTVPGGTSPFVALQWANPVGTAGDDYDVCVRLVTSAILACSAFTQNGDDDAIEFIPSSQLPCPPGPACVADIQVTLFAGVARPFKLFCIPCTLQEFAVDPGSIFGHPAMVEVVAVAAAPASAPNSIEFFSSPGPSTIAFPAPETRSKPDVTGVDRVRTSRPGFNPFTGTSAAAPHVGAIAALMLEVNPGLTSPELRNLLTRSAIDLGLPGFDHESGFGRADAVAAIGAATPPVFAGTRWIDRSIDPFVYLRSVFFVDSSVGWAVGAYQPSALSPEQRVFKSVDGGRTWTTQLAALRPGYLFSAFFVDRNIGWVGGSHIGFDGGPQILTTSDGGASWTLYNFPGLSNNIMDIHGQRPSAAWAVGDTPSVLFSTDGFQSYQPQTLNGIIGSQIWNIEMPSSTVGYAAVPSGQVFKTTNGGQDWNSVFTTPGGLGVFAMSFVNESTGWIAGGASVTSLVARTIDGGVTWLPLPLPVAEQVQGVSFVDSMRGWLVVNPAGQGQIWSTRDAGSTWELEYTASSPLTNIFARDRTHVWAVGQNGTILQRQMESGLVAAPGPGGGPHIRGFTAHGSLAPPNTMAYPASFTGGAFVAVSDLDGNGSPSVITGAGAGGGPHVRAFNADGSPRTTNFFAYVPSFSGGVRVAACDFTGDGRAELVLGAGPGGGPHVRVTQLDSSGNPGNDLASFFAYNAAFSGGIFVACGNVEGLPEPNMNVITAADAGGGPHVRVFRLDAGAPGGVLPVLEFFAYNPAFTGGVRVAAANIDGSDRASIILGAGPGGGPHVRAVKSDGSGLVDLASFFAYPVGFSGGVFVAAGNVTGGSAAQIVTGAGAGGGPHVRVFTGSGGDTGISFFAYDPAFTGGVRVGVAP